MSDNKLKSEIFEYIQKEKSPVTISQILSALNLQSSRFEASRQIRALETEGRIYKKQENGKALFSADSSDQDPLLNPVKNNIMHTQNAFNRMGADIKPSDCAFSSDSAGSDEKTCIYSYNNNQKYNCADFSCAVPDNCTATLEDTDSDEGPRKSTVTIKFNESETVDTEKKYSEISLSKYTFGEEADLFLSQLGIQCETIFFQSSLAKSFNDQITTLGIVDLDRRVSNKRGIAYIIQKRDFLGLTGSEGGAGYASNGYILGQGMVCYFSFDIAQENIERDWFAAQLNKWLDSIEFHSSEKPIESYQKQSFVTEKLSKDSIEQFDNYFQNIVSSTARLHDNMQNVIRFRTDCNAICEINTLRAEVRQMCRDIAGYYSENCRDIADAVNRMSRNNRGNPLLPKLYETAKRIIDGLSNSEKPRINATAGGESISFEVKDFKKYKDSLLTPEIQSAIRADKSSQNAIKSKNKNEGTKAKEPPKAPAAPPAPAATDKAVPEKPDPSEIFSKLLRKIETKTNEACTLFSNAWNETYTKKDLTAIHSLQEREKNVSGQIRSLHFWNFIQKWKLSEEAESLSRRLADTYKQSKKHAEKKQSEIDRLREAPKQIKSFLDTIKSESILEELPSKWLFSQISYLEQFFIFTKCTGTIPECAEKLTKENWQPKNTSQISLDEDHPIHYDGDSIYTIEKEIRLIKTQKTQEMRKAINYGNITADTLEGRMQMILTFLSYNCEKCYSATDITIMVFDGEYAVCSTSYALNKLCERGEIYKRRIKGITYYSLFDHDESWKRDL